MKKYCRFISLALILTALTVISPFDAGAAAVSQQGTLNGAAYRIELPENWNGTLLVFQHGYRDVADAPGEVEDHTAHVDPPSLEPFLLSMGYGLAMSAFRVNGYNIQEGIEDTKALMSFFRDSIGKPDRAILWGRSGGSDMSAEILENGSGLFDGAIATCGIMAGIPAFFDGALDFDLAYDAAFGWHAAWGSIGDLDDNLDFEIDVLPAVLPQLSNHANFGKFEFIRLVNHLPLQGFYPSMLLANMSFSTEARAQLERKFGGPGAQNIGHVYRLTDAEKAYLAGLGVNADPLLDYMNVHTAYEARQSVSRYMEKFVTFDGNIKKPLLSMHAIYDGVALVENESVYKAINEAAGREDQLLQVYTNGVGHCTFTADQIVQVIRGMESWLNTGTKPDLSFFPATLGFEATFQPGPWPQPLR